MKNIIILLAAIFTMQVANAQQQINPMLNHSNDKVINPMQKAITDKGKLNVQKKLALQNPKTITWNWDTIIEYDTINNFTQRLTQTFNTNGKVLVFKIENWQNNAWINADSTSYIYDANGNLTTQLSEGWQNNAWAVGSKSTYTYDANGNRLTQLFQIWDTTYWVNNDRDTFTYDANGNMLTRIYETWVDSTSTWMIVNRDTCTYDANGNMLTQLIEGWQNNAWVNASSVTFTYNSNGDLLTRLYVSWQNNAWVNLITDTCTFNVNGNMLTDLKEIWQNNAWVNYQKDTLTYDANGNMLTQILEVWDTINWLNSNRYTYTYDANGNSVTGKAETWVNNSWKLNENGALDVLSSKNIIYYVYCARYQASFVSYISGIVENKENTELKVYPNPTKDNLTIETNTNTEQRIEIVNLMGQTIYTNIINKKATINTSAFPSGVYILKLYTDKEIVVKKFIKE